MTVVLPDVVVVTGPPFRLSVTAPPRLAKVRVCPVVGMMPMVPPAVVMLDESPVVIVRGFAPPPDVRVMADAPVVLTAAPFCSVSCGVPMAMVVPADTVGVPDKMLILPPLVAAVKFTAFVADTGPAIARLASEVMLMSVELVTFPIVAVPVAMDILNGPPEPLVVPATS